jgi:hypothetical protein
MVRFFFPDSDGAVSVVWGSSVTMVAANTLGSIFKSTVSIILINSFNLSD